MSLKQIAAENGGAPGTVGYWVRKHGLEANGSSRYSPKRALDRTRLQSCLDTGMTLSTIASEFGVSTSTVGNWVRRTGLGGTKRTRRMHEIRRARSEGKRSLQLECPEHGVTDFWIGKRTVRCRKCNSRGVARRRRRVKEILIAEAGGRCLLCGYDRTPAALHFHHLDRLTKSFGVSQAGISRSLADSREEAKKCALLCSNCHAEVEVGAARLPRAKNPNQAVR